MNDSDVDYLGNVPLKISLMANPKSRITIQLLEEKGYTRNARMIRDAIVYGGQVDISFYPIEHRFSLIRAIEKDDPEIFDEEY